MREDRGREILLFGSALALRLAWIFDFNRLAFFDLPTGDALFYARQAARILDGHLLGTDLSYPSSPLYPYLIAPFFLLPGRSAFAAIYVAQAILDAAHAVLLKRIGGRLFSPAAGWCAGIAWAGYGLAVFFSADMVEAVAAAFLADLFLFLAVPGEARGSPRDPGTGAWRPTERISAALTDSGAGAAFAAGCLLRPHFLPLFPLAAAAHAWMRPRDRRARSLALFALGSGALLGLSLARNAAVSGETVLISPYSGLNAYLGNHPGSRGYLSFPAGRGLRNDYDLRAAAHTYPEAVAGRPMTEAEVSRFWWLETAREAFQHPAAWAALIGRKAVLFWSSYEAPNHLDFYFFRSGSVPLSASAIPFGLIAPLALTGVALVAAGSSRGRGPIVLAVLSVSYWASVTLFFVADRFRLPATGWLCLLGGASLAEVLSRARRAPLAAAWPAALALVLGAALHAPGPERHGAREHVMLANALSGRGRLAEAEALLRRAVEIDPQGANARFNLGRLLVRAGRYEAAAEEFARAADLAPDFAAAQIALGDLARREGTPAAEAEARRRYEAALALEPYGSEAERLRRALTSSGSPG